MDEGRGGEIALKLTERLNCRQGISVTNTNDQEIDKYIPD